MGQREQHGVVAGRPNDDRAEAEQLLEICNREEGLELPIDVDPARAEGDGATQFRCYEQGELIGFAWLPREQEPEACLMVHPDHRRRRVGRALLDAVRDEVRRRGLPGFLLICDEASPSGRAFAEAVGARYRGAEYRMELDPAAIDRTRPRHDELQLRRAGGDDLVVLARLQAAAFDDAEGDTREFVERGLQEPNRRYYLGMLAGEPVGLLRLSAWEGNADVTSFGVPPEQRGRGYGRQMLLDAVDILLAEGWRRILIEVATDNERALGLYRSCGFRVVASFGFYEF